MNRRSFLACVGLAPLALPALAVAKSSEVISFDAVTISDVNFIEARRFQIEEIANAFRVGWMTLQEARALESFPPCN